MNCYHHANTPAVGLCSGCNIGICHECQSDSEFFTCKNENCISISKIKYDILKSSQYQVDKSSNVVKTSYINATLVGLFLVCMGYFFNHEFDTTFGLFGLSFMGFGLVFMGFGLYNIITKKYSLTVNTQ